MEKILKIIAYIVILVVVIPITIIELIFKIASFITVFLIFLVMMFLAPLFKDFYWPNPIQKFIDYVFSLNFVITGKVINSYKKALWL
jgi:hypothetical protein